MHEEINDYTVYRSYKDRVFRMLFKEKGRLLELYNALNGSNYTNEDDLQITTLENAIYMKAKNDVSFMIVSNLYLYEHQSSYCPNMPLRGFLYFADMYKKQLKDVELSCNKRIMIPTPQYIVFYNGTERDADRFTQKLSDSFESGEEGCIELIVTSININVGHNQNLLDRSPTLYGYSYFVSLIRENIEKYRMELGEAVEKAIDECIGRDVLRDFLTEQRAEVIAMSIYEYNEENARISNFEAGEEVGYIRGEERLNQLNILLTENNRTEDMLRAMHDKEYRNLLYAEFEL